MSGSVWRSEAGTSVWSGTHSTTRGQMVSGTLAGEILGKWVNGFWLKPYKGRMSANPFQKKEDPQDPENQQEEGLAPEVTDPGRPDTTDN